MTYPGVDPQLNSFLLQPGGGWESFRFEYTVYICRIIEPDMPEDYYAVVKRSLIDTTVDGKPEFHAAMIYRLTDGEFPGVPITRIEVLSEEFKPGGIHHETYLKRRHETINGGINLVEIDYLYHTDPILDAIPSYPRRDPQATPYYVLASRVQQQVIDFYAVAIDQPLPRLTVPLADDDTALLDLQATYQRTVDGSRLLRMLAERPLADRGAFTEADLKKIGGLS